MEACGHNRPPRRVPSNGNARNCSLSVECGALPSPVRDATISCPGSRSSRTNQENAMSESSLGTPSPVRPPEDQLDSWKEIAVYLKRDVTTVQRWEKREGMPVHRHLHDRIGSVYAFSSELDAWVQSRRLRLEEEEKELRAEPPADEEVDVRLTRTSWARLWFVLGGVVVLALVAVIYVMLRGRTGHATQPKITSLAVLPLNNLSGDSTQEYLAD